MHPSAHLDSFARDHLPPPEQWPELVFDRPELQFGPRLNAATELLDRWVEQGQGQRPCVQGAGVRWTYAELQAEANRIANVLVQDLGVVPGHRVLLRGTNTPQLAACWFAVIKAGAIAASSSSGLAFSSSTAEAPTLIGNSSRPPRPKVKASGGLPMKTSCAVACRQCGGQQRQMASTSRWKCIVPLGWPVVPEVKAISAQSSLAVSTFVNVAGWRSVRASRPSGAVLR